MVNINKYGYCCKCGTPLKPVWFTEEEYKTEEGRMYKTGRKRKACSHLQCPSCFYKEIIDDSFDERWNKI